MCLAQYTPPSGGGGGGGTVTSVSFTGGLITVANATTTPALTVAGTSGGIPYFSSTSTWASSGVLTANGLMLGGGAGAAPTVLGSLGTTTTVLHGNASGAPSFSSVSLTADVTGLLPNASLANPSLTANGATCTLGSTCAPMSQGNTIGGSLTSGGFLYADGSSNLQSAPAIRRAGVGALQLGASGTLGTLTFGNASSGTILLTPTTGALGTITLTMPATTGTIITSGDTGTVTNAMLAGSIANSKLGNSSITVDGNTCTLGSTCVSALTINSTAISGSGTNALLYSDGAKLQNATGITRSAAGTLTFTTSVVTPLVASPASTDLTIQAPSGYQLAIGPSATCSTGTGCLVDLTATTGATQFRFGSDGSTGSGHTSATSTNVTIYAGQSQSGNPFAVLNSAGTSLASVDGSGNISVLGITAGAHISAPGLRTSANNAVSFGLNISYNAAIDAFQFFNGTGTITNSTGAFIGVGITPTYNQTSTAAGTDLYINRTETAVGSGAQYFINMAVGGAQKAFIDHTGVIQGSGYKSSDGSAGVTVTTCTSFKNGLCVAGT